MSQWTHVSGNIRFDAMRALGLPHRHPSEILGPVSTFEEWNEDSTIPCGSEGSLSYSVCENPDECCLAAYSVSVFGDLRDYSDLKEIGSWLETITNGQMIRQATVYCSVEFGEQCVFIHDGEKWQRQDLPKTA